MVHAPFSHLEKGRCSTVAVEPALSYFHFQCFKTPCDAWAYLGPTTSCNNSAASLRPSFNGPTGSLQCRDVQLVPRTPINTMREALPCFMPCTPDAGWRMTVAIFPCPSHPRNVVAKSGRGTERRLLLSDPLYIIEPCACGLTAEGN